MKTETNTTKATAKPTASNGHRGSGKRYDDTFKANAVSTLRAKGNLKQIAKQFGITAKSLRTWADQQTQQQPQQDNQRSVDVFLTGTTQVPTAARNVPDISAQQFLISRKGALQSEIRQIESALKSF